MNRSQRHDDQGRSKPGEAAAVELQQCNTAVGGLFAKEQAGDLVAADDEENSHTMIAAYPLDAGMPGDDGENRKGTQPVKGGAVCETSAVEH